MRTFETFEQAIGDSSNMIPLRSISQSYPVELHALNVQEMDVRVGEWEIWHHARRGLTIRHI
jgi:hypothetical protein